MTRVLFIPDFGDSNEYQNLLRKSVESDRFDTVSGTLHTVFPLIRNVRQEQIDVVHLIWTHPFFLIQNLSSVELVNAIGTYFRAGLFLLDLFLVRLYGAEIVWTVHNKHNHERRHIWLDHTVSRVTARMASEMTVECSAAKKTIVDLFWIDNPEKIHVIEEGSYIDSYPNSVSAAEARESLNIASETQLYVYFGQIREYKGVDQLIDAFAEAELPNAKLLVVGNPFNQQIEMKLGAAIENTTSVEPVFEFVPNNEIQLYMNAADVVALPYRDILTSGSVLLAMSFGRPVVTPDLGCIPALVGDEGNIIYEANNRQSLRESLEAANSMSEEELEAVGTRNYEIAAELTWDRVGSMTKSVYDAALDGRS
jgi:glycosyltransferase involved in cell wall biosynthesis